MRRSRYLIIPYLIGITLSLSTILWAFWSNQIHLDIADEQTSELEVGMANSVSSKLVLNPQLIGDIQLVPVGMLGVGDNTNAREYVVVSFDVVWQEKAYNVAQGAKANFDVLVKSSIESPISDATLVLYDNEFKETIVQFALHAGMGERIDEMVIDNYLSQVSGSSVETFTQTLLNLITKPITRYQKSDNSIIPMRYYGSLADELNFNIFLNINEITTIYLVYYAYVPIEELTDYIQGATVSIEVTVGLSDDHWDNNVVVLPSD